MDDEIDLRRYWIGLWRRWRLIAALAIAGGLIAAALSLISPNVYEATALVSVSPPRNALKLEGLTQDTALPVRAYPELALSGDVVAAVFVKAAPLLPAGQNTQAEFTSLLSTEAASDPTLLRLKVRGDDPQRAAQIANIWAAAFAARAGQLFGQDQANLVLYQQQLADAKSNLDQADSALAAFQSGNQVNLLAAQLASQQASLTDDLNRQHQLQSLTQDVHDLLGRLNNLSASAPANLAEDLALISVASRIYGAQSVLTSTGQTQLSAMPIQLQIGAGQPLVGPTVADQRALAQNLSDTIAARLTDIGSQVTARGPQILTLQGQVAEAQVKEAQLTRARDLAQGEYTQLATQVAQASIATQDSSVAIQIASQAAVPTDKIGPRRTLNTLTGVGVGLLLGIVISLGMEALQPAPVAASPAIGDAARVRA